MSLRVILIDDHTLFRVGLEGLLTSRGIEVVASVGSGQDCLRLVDDLTPDIILLDMRMPGINGLGVLEMIRKHNPELPTVMLTTSTDEGDLLESLRQGAADLQMLCRRFSVQEHHPPDVVLLHGPQRGRREQAVFYAIRAALVEHLVAILVGERHDDAHGHASVDPQVREILHHLVGRQLVDGERELQKGLRLVGHGLHGPQPVAHRLPAGGGRCGP